MLSRLPALPHTAVNINTPVGLSAYRSQGKQNLNGMMNQYKLTVVCALHTTVNKLYNGIPQSFPGFTLASAFASF